jgi:hypothetical protein
MKASFLKASLTLLSVILLLGFILTGCKKETPPLQELTAKEKQFLSAPDAVTCKLEKVEISKMDIPKGPLASNFFRYMEEQNRHYVKQGQITIANRPFKIILGFHPEREFYIYDIKNRFIPYWSGSQSLYSYHKIDNKLYEFILIEDGTKIAARPYQGPLGIIKFSKGSRELEKVEFWGSLQKEDYVAVPIGTIKENRPDMVTECAIPAGDYKLSQIYVTYDNLLIRTSDNSTNAQDQSGRRETVYGIHVRQDKPYILNFSNEPTVIFSRPSMSKTTFSRGDVIEFTTILIDPKLDIMIKTLYDTSIKVNKQYKDRDGMVHTIKENKSLDPNIVIARADGEVIAEGVFSTYGYTWWQVPDDLQINGDEEELTVTVTYETQKLYGKVSAQLKIKIRK